MLRLPLRPTFGRNGNDAFAFQQRNRIFRTESGAHPAADAVRRSSLGLAILVQIRRAGVAFLDAGAAPGAAIGIDHRQIVGGISDRRNRVVHRIAAAASAAVADAGLFSRGVEIGVVGLVYQSRRLGAPEYVERLRPGDHPGKPLGRGITGRFAERKARFALVGLLARPAEQILVMAAEAVPHGDIIEFVDDRHIPEDLRLAFKILKNADCLPAEIELKKEIERTEDLLAAMTDTRERYRAIRKLNYLILRLNTMRNGTIELDIPQQYEQILADRIASHTRNGQAA